MAGTINAAWPRVGVAGGALAQAGNGFCTGRHLASVGSTNVWWANCLREARATGAGASQRTVDGSSRRLSALTARTSCGNTRCLSHVGLEAHSAIGKRRLYVVTLAPCADRATCFSRDRPRGHLSGRIFDGESALLGVLPARMPREGSQADASGS